MIVLGVDPGLATLGWGVIEAGGGRQRLIDYGCILTTPEQTLPDRLLSIQTGMGELLGAFTPTPSPFEELFFARNVTTALTVGAARGVSVAVCAAYTGEMYEYTPMQVKQAVTGYGKADKRQIQEWSSCCCTWRPSPAPDDAADALAVALTHAATGAACAQFRMK
jgi:crossover junction endodeoxyribonuclease RuvC